LLDPIEEPFDQVASAVEIGAEADRTVAIAFGRDVGPCTFLDGMLSNPIGVVGTVGKQHRSRLQSGQKFSCEPIIVYFDQAHFTRDFKRATGVSPGQYRLSAHAGAEASA
jgi:hypothetical protein